MNKVQRALQEAYQESLSEDKEFSTGVFAARKAFNGDKLRKAADEGTSTKLILWLLSDQPLDRGARRTLAALLAGDLNTTGRRAVGAAKRQAYRELMLEARAYRLKLQAAGKSYLDAIAAAARWAKKDPRARSHSCSTIERALRGSLKRI